MGRALSAVVLACGCATYSPPQAAPPSFVAPAGGAPARDLEGASRHVRDAERLLGKLDAAGARRSLDLAAAALGPAPALSEAFDVWVRIETVRAVIEVGDGRRDEAAARLREVVGKRPDLIPDPGRVPPEVRELWAQVQADHAAASARAPQGVPPLAVWNGVPANDGPDRPLYRKAWWWAAVGVIGGAVWVAVTRPFSPSPGEVTNP